MQAAGGPRTGLPLEVCAAEMTVAVRQFTGQESCKTTRLCCCFVK